MKLLNTLKNNRASVLLALTALATIATPSHSQSLTPTRSPSQTPYGVLGMSTVTSAEAMGQGVMNLNIRGKLVEQSEAVPGVAANQRLTTVSAGAALGVNSYMDVFVNMNVYNFNQNPGSNGSGWGSSVIGAKGTLPAVKGAPIRMGMQVAAIFGTSSNQFNTNRLDGFNYLETRDGGSDVLIRLTQSYLGTDESNGGTGFNVHLNQGAISSFEEGKEMAALAGIGVEIIPISQLILGLEANYRTFLSDINIQDPLWVTPSITWRSPKHVNVNLGVDISLSGDRTAPEPAALAAYRIFGGLSGSLDTQKGRRDRNARKARADSLERAALEARAARGDGNNDSLYNAMRARQINDSLALAEANRRLRYAMANMTTVEKEFLSSGLLVLDAVYFETGKTEISKNSEPYLELIAKMLTKYPKLQIAIDGHTDNVGDQDYNQKLSHDRSTAVADYMRNAAPELRGRMTARGHNFTQPKATNETAEGREMNRRTELSVLNKEALKEYR